MPFKLYTVDSNNQFHEIKASAISLKDYNNFESKLCIEFDDYEFFDQVFHRSIVLKTFDMEREENYRFLQSDLIIPNIVMRMYSKFIVDPSSGNRIFRVELNSKVIEILRRINRQTSRLKEDNTININNKYNLSSLSYFDRNIVQNNEQQGELVLDFVRRE
ncbi:uncharacterized protein ASCRUDRAFT_115646 [Ascoidea rubescens DSM 1968]|uniref:Uncharacterized protein n=1 Tax=Ascoidea rubescens DSM 1968 TaxID=1344418 RepID=A0A1D2VBG2_9ASCO|nr:hypothetical protein ASCRUDRAFT_115646 [Ascoidea rubescens DSM 1968]ODV59034.1 hypothetical protein ASCRUDRAFT_115646 [Ascoidea rubescens DSM 1968]